MVKWMTILLMLLSSRQAHTDEFKAQNEAPQLQMKSRGQARFHGLRRGQLLRLHHQHMENLMALRKLSHSEMSHRKSNHSVGDWLPRVNVTCPEINWTFFYEEPFLHITLPACGPVIQPKMVIYRAGVYCDLDPYNLPNNTTDVCLDTIFAKHEIDNLVVITHGFLKTFSNSYWMHDMGKAFIERNQKTAVLIVGWGHGSGGAPFPDPFYYYQAAANTRYMGVASANMVKEIFTKHPLLTNSLKSNELQVHCIGHSLGAHICGFMGRTLQLYKPPLPKLRRISGLDPAGPLFAIDVPYPFNFINISEKARLNPEDGDFVDIIHTDGRARFTWQVVPQYGTMMRLGHADFYPGYNNEFGWNQPGCYQVYDIGSCSHSRAHDLFLSSLNQPCHSDEVCQETEPVTSECLNMTASSPAMGYFADQSKYTDKSRAFVVVTELYVPPFCNHTRNQP